MKTLINVIQNYSLHCAHERNYSPHTIKAYRIDLNGFAKFLTTAKSGTAPLTFDKLTRNDLRDYLVSLNNSKPRTIRRKIACIRSFFNYLHQEKQVTENIAEGWKCNIRIGISLPRTISHVAVGGILGKVHHIKDLKYKLTSAQKEPWAHTRAKALIEMLYCTGMRVGEVAALLQNSIDLDGDTITVHGKGNRERMIPIVTKELRSALREWISLRRKRHPHAVCFFVNRFGDKLGEQSIRAIVRQIGQAGANLHVTPHMFRHTLATQLLEEGVDLRHIQRLLGHSSIMTTTIYTQVSDMSQRKCLQKRHPRKNFKQ